MREIYVFEIPVYRCSRDKHAMEMERNRERIAERLRRYGGNGLPSGFFEECVQRFHAREWYPWKFNEIVGWIRLYVLGRQIRGETWFIRAKRIRRDLKRKRIFYVGKAFEVDISPSDTSQEIFEAILAELKKLSAEKLFRGRFIDLETFVNVGPYINWVELLGF